MKAMILAAALALAGCSANPVASDGSVPADGSAKCPAAYPRLEWVAVHFGTVRVPRCFPV